MPNISTPAHSHTILMMRLQEALTIAKQLHPEFDPNTLVGRATLVGWLTDRIDLLLAEDTLFDTIDKPPKLIYCTKCKWCKTSETEGACEECGNFLFTSTPP